MQEFLGSETEECAKEPFTEWLSYPLGSIYSLQLLVFPSQMFSPTPELLVKEVVVLTTERAFHRSKDKGGTDP